MPNITIWNEFRHERNADHPSARLYPDGIHETIAGFLREDPDLTVRTAVLDEPEHGLTVAVLAETDVLLWWGHMAHDEVDDAVVARVQAAVLGGMGLIALHSAHASKIFTRLMGTSGTLAWRVHEGGERERLWNLQPAHPITQGIGNHFEIPHAEMYGERFDIPEPEKLVFVSWFQGGEVFRSGCTWTRGNGKVFYFRPGHETFPVFHQPEVQTVIRNAVRWALPATKTAPAYQNRKTPNEAL